MGFTSLQFCMDSDWLQEAESSRENMLDSSTTSPSAADTLAACTTTTRPQVSDMAIAAAALMDDGGRRLRPPHHDHPQKCPRCESTHTKFCYYNNYSLSQPRYFCKTCRRYWTKGGTLRNIPVGGGCRKNKKPSSSNSSSSSTSTSSGKKPCNIVATTSSTNELMALTNSHQNYQNTLLGFSHFGGFYSTLEHSNVGFLENKYGCPKPIDFLDNKFDLMGVSNDNMVMVDHMSNVDHHQQHHYHMISNYDHHHNNYNNHQEDHQRVTTIMDVKPNPKLLSLDWQQDQGYSNGLISSWNGLMNGYGTSTKTNSLV